MKKKSKKSIQESILQELRALKRLRKQEEERAARERDREYFIAKMRADSCP